MRILSALGALLVLVTGRAVPEPGRGDDVVLLADLRRGMAPSSDLYEPPEFVLYGNGRAVAQEEGRSGVPRLVEYRLTPQRVRVLFADAEDAGLFDDEDYSLDEQVVDAGSLVIMLRTTEREHLVRIVLPNPEHGGARGGAAAFAESLRPSRWAESDFTQPPKPYRPGRVAVIHDVVDGTSDEPRAWPLTEEQPVGPRCVVLIGSSATAALELGEEEPPNVLWQHGGVTFHAWARPLLPDEADCRASERREIG